VSLHGVGGVALEWFHHYLSNCKQFVFINYKCSTLLNIILGPLLFLLNINDLPEASSLLSSLFADDTKLFASGLDINVKSSFVNEEFKKVVQFFRQHKMALHPSKKNFLLYTIFSSR
jgi:hypothetical protein